LALADPENIFAVKQGEKTEWTDEERELLEKRKVELCDF